MSRLFLGLVFVLLAEPALACPTCSTGDSTLTMIGSEQLYAGRLRAAAIVTHRSGESGGAGGRVAHDEWRTDLALSLSLSRRVSVGVSVPLIARALDFTPGGSDDLFGVGDPTVLARVVLFADRIIQPRHVLSLDAGLMMPLAPTRTYTSGAPKIPEQQPGMGAFAPIGGLAWDVFARPWSGRISANGTWTSSARGGDRPSRTLTVTALVQRALVPELALRAGIDVRIDSRARADGRTDYDSGGVLMSAGADLVLAPIEDLTLLAGVRVPVVDALWGRQSEDAVLTFGLTWDID